TTVSDAGRRVRPSTRGARTTKSTKRSREPPNPRPTRRTRHHGARPRRRFRGPRPRATRRGNVDRRPLRCGVFRRGERLRRSARRPSPGGVQRRTEQQTTGTPRGGCTRADRFDGPGGARAMSTGRTRRRSEHEEVTVGEERARRTGRWRGVSALALVAGATGIFTASAGLVLVGVVGIAFAALSRSAHPPPA